MLTFVYVSSGKFDEAFSTAIRYDDKTKSNGNFIFTFAQDAFRNKQYGIASKAYDYIINNFPSSSLVPVARIGYATTLKNSIDEKYEEERKTWKPYTQPVILHKNEYLSVVNAYRQLLADYPNNAIYPQVLYNMANINFENLYDLKKADSLFAVINNNFPKSDYSTLSSIARGKIAVYLSNLNDAKLYLMKAFSYGRINPNEKAEANYFLARIAFWNGNFSQSLKLLSEITTDMSADYTNDAIELSALINAVKRDSLTLSKYAQADYYSFQNKFKEAANEFKTLADNPNLFIINNFANYKFAEMLIAENDFPTAIKILEVLSDSTKNAIFADKALFLLAQTYRYGIKNVQKAVENYQKLLEKFPNSLYFDRARESLNLLQTNNG